MRKGRIKEWSRRKKGVAGIIAATILFAMIFTTGVAYFAFVQYNYQLQQIAARDRAQMEFEQSLEQFIVTGVLTSDKIGVKVNNTGPITIKVVSIFVSDNGGTLHQVNDSLSIIVNSGASSDPIPTGVSYATGKIYTIKVVSERGNVEIGRYPPPPSPESQIALIARGVGPVLIEFESFRWASYSGSLNGLNLAGLSWNPGWLVQSGYNVIWKVTVINHDIKDIYLDNRTIFTISSASRETAQKIVYWYIVNATGGVVSAYKGSGRANDGSIKIPANPNDPATGGAPTTIYFASKVRSSTVSNGLGTDDEGIWIVFITLQGKWSDGTLYAQTLIPIVAIEVV